MTTTPTFILDSSAHQLATQLQIVRKAQANLKKEEEGIKEAIKTLTDPIVEDTNTTETITFLIQDSDLTIQLVPGSNTGTDRKVVLALAGPLVLEKATTKSQYQQIKVGKQKAVEDKKEEG